MSSCKQKKKNRRLKITTFCRTIVSSDNMAAPMRLLVRRVIRFSHRNINVTAAGVPGRPGCCWEPSSCRCFSDAAGDRSTHFGFETVPETEKAKRGELRETHSQCAASSCVNTTGKRTCLSVDKHNLRDGIFGCFGPREDLRDNSAYIWSTEWYFYSIKHLNLLNGNCTKISGVWCITFMPNLKVTDGNYYTVLNHSAAFIGKQGNIIIYFLNDVCTRNRKQVVPVICMLHILCIILSDWCLLNV